MFSISGVLYHTFASQHLQCFGDLLEHMIARPENAYPSSQSAMLALVSARRKHMEETWISSRKEFYAPSQSKRKTCIGSLAAGQVDMVLLTSNRSRNSSMLALSPDKNLGCDILANLSTTL